MRKLILTAAVILLIGILAACNQGEENDEAQEEQETAVETADVTTGDLVIEKSIYGRTEPNSTTPVMAPGAGEVTELEVANGDTVDEDDHLATIQTPAGNQRVTAQASGEIANLNVEENAMASDSDPMMVIADFDSMTVNLTVSSDTLDLLEAGDTYPVVIEREEYEAEITSVGTMPNDTGLYPVEATVENGDDAIVSGMVAVMNVPENRVKDTIIVPTEAVVTQSGETFVYVVEDNQAIQKTITVQESQSDETAVEGDIQEGDQIVVNGLLTLSDGMNVNVAEEEDNS
ncbi:efflux RND transporter periplasmic adaptor subunit [Lentibacillus amyloliquefaciens]|uniref:Efflux transporter periplasmic adaptor subunit n=1 Tax=Lentibacillus amyloliquefaciens TaxID=1472767 RepID=A0A0U3NTJ5_9BACI|nr:efflux RND transporter periplasmic adaptor subunit [Lentibacillus amyloliquefaciens]ALX49915.1 efflux transporter periplasmic adaptor subunit [Lentibacillus amyloliquefaciens]